MLLEVDDLPQSFFTAPIMSDIILTVWFQWEFRDNLALKLCLLKTWQFWFGGIHFYSSQSALISIHYLCGIIFHFKSHLALKITQNKSSTLASLPRHVGCYTRLDAVLHHKLVIGLEFWLILVSSLLWKVERLCWSLSSEDDQTGQK